MIGVAHDWFLLAFNRGDKWCVPYQENHDNYVGNEDRFLVKMTVDQLDELSES